jgi:hypothetical protein
LLFENHFDIFDLEIWHHEVSASGGRVWPVGTCVFGLYCCSLVWGDWGLVVLYELAMNNKEYKMCFLYFFVLFNHGLFTFKPCNCTIKNAHRNSFYTFGQQGNLLNFRTFCFILHRMPIIS